MSDHEELEAQKSGASPVQGIEQRFRKPSDSQELPQTSVVAPGNAGETRSALEMGEQEELSWFKRRESLVRRLVGTIEDRLGDNCPEWRALVSWEMDEREARRASEPAPGNAGNESISVDEALEHADSVKPSLDAYKRELGVEGVAWDEFPDEVIVVLAAEVRRLREESARRNASADGWNAKACELEREARQLREENARLSAVEETIEHHLADQVVQLNEQNGQLEAKLARVEALPKAWVDTANAYRDDGASTAKADAFEDCADQLETALRG